MELPWGGWHFYHRVLTMLVLRQLSSMCPQRALQALRGRELMPGVLQLGAPWPHFPTCSLWIYAALGHCGSSGGIFLIQSPNLSSQLNRSEESRLKGLMQWVGWRRIQSMTEKTLLLSILGKGSAIIVHSKEDQHYRLYSQFFKMRSWTNLSILAKFSLGALSQWPVNSTLYSINEEIDANKIWVICPQDMINQWIHEDQKVHIPPLIDCKFNANFF